jgi:hypothetical protein
VKRLDKGNSKQSVTGSHKKREKNRSEEGEEGRWGKSLAANAYRMPGGGVSNPAFQAQ